MGREAAALPLLALNHVSFICKSVVKSVQFYEQVLDFVLIKRPSSFDFEGAWYATLCSSLCFSFCFSQTMINRVITNCRLFNHGIGIHLLQAAGNNVPAEKKAKINPKDNHISFQCTDMNLIIQQLEDMKIEYVTAVVTEGGIVVDQLFFHDPDGYMIEICNCQNIPVLPLSSSCPIKNNVPIPTKNLAPTPSYLGMFFFYSSTSLFNRKVLLGFTKTILVVLTQQYYSLLRPKTYLPLSIKGNILTISFSNTSKLHVILLLLSIKYYLLL